MEKKFTTIFVSKEVHNKLLRKKTELTIEKGKRVTWDELFLILLEGGCDGK